ncbi:lipopolysaccharide biosynthesis protein [Candidatus Cloacimonadota bacterium]
MSGYIRKTLEYAAGNTFNKVLLLLLLPLFTRFMTPEEYAVYSNITIFVSFLSLVYLLGLQQALFSHFYKFKDERYQFTVISSILISITIFGIFLSYIVFRYRTTLADWITTNPEFDNIFIYVSIILFCDSLYAIILRIINTLERSMNYALLSIVRNLSLLLLISIGTLAGKFSIETIFIYMTISSLISLLIALFNVIKILSELRKFSKSISALFSFPILLDMLTFGLPMIPGTIAFMVLRLSDRYMLTYLSANGLHDVGIYVIGYRIGMILTFLNTIISLVYIPYAMKIADDPRASYSYKKMFKAYAIWGGFLGFLIVIYTWEISLILLDSSYYEAVKLVVFGVLSSYLAGLLNLVNITFYIRKKAGNIALAVGLGATINIILNFILIPVLGVYGAGIASVISYLFIFLLNYRISENLNPLNYDFRYVIYSLVSILLISTVNFFFRIGPVFTISKFVILAGFVSYYYFKYIRKDLKKMSLKKYVAENFKI